MYIPFNPMFLGRRILQRDFSGGTATDPSNGWQYSAGNPATLGMNAAQAGANIASSGQQAALPSKMSGAETQQYKSSFDLGKLIQQLLTQQTQDPTKAYEQQTGQLGTELYNQTLANVQNPDAQYLSTLNPQLQAANDYINTQYAKRGLLQSGMNMESMGRAGVDLAIQEAQGRMANRQQALSNANTLASNIQNVSSGGLTGLANLYSQQQQSGQSAKTLQANAAMNALPSQTYGNQAQMGASMGANAAQFGLPAQDPLAQLKASGLPFGQAGSNYGQSAFPSTGTGANMPTYNPGATFNGVAVNS